MVLSLLMFLTHTRHTTLGMTPLDELSTRHRSLSESTQHSQQTNILAAGGIRTHNISRRSPANLWLRPRGYWERPIIVTCPWSRWGKYFTKFWAKFHIPAVKGKAVPLQAGSGPEASRKLRFPYFMTTAQDGGRVAALRTGRLYPQETLLILISIKGWVDPRTIVRSEGFYVNENFKWHQLGSNQWPSDL